MSTAGNVNVEIASDLEQFRVSIIRMRATFFRLIYSSARCTSHGIDTPAVVTARDTWCTLRDLAEEM